MRSRAPVLATLTLLLTLAAGAAPARSQSLRSVPMDHWAYTYAEALLLRHPELAPHVRFANRPWTQGEFLEIIEATRGAGFQGDPLAESWAAAIERDFATDPQDVEDRLHYFNAVDLDAVASRRTDHASFEPAFREPTFDEERGDPIIRALLRHHFAIQRSETFLLGWRSVVDQNIRNDPARRSEGQRGTEAAFEVLDAYALFQAGPLRLTVGRQETSLGPGRGTSVFVSDSIPALDQVRLEIRAEPIRLTGMIAQLSRERPNRRLNEAGGTIEGSVPSAEDPVPFDVTRWLYLHRLDWRVHDRLELSIGEAAVVTGIDRGIEFRYANLLLPYFVSQEERDETSAADVNVVVNVDGVFHGPGKTRFYGDLYVQEFFIDADKREEIGNQLAGRAGFEWADPLGRPGTTVGAEYTRVGVFTYLHRGLNTNWTTFGVPIGSSLGPDADQATMWLEQWLTPHLRVGGEVMVRRGGERSVRTLESVIGAGNPEFPSGIVQKELRAGLEARGRWPDLGLEGRLRVARREVDGIGNDPDRDGGFWEAEAGLSYRWRIQ